MGNEISQDMEQRDKMKRKIFNFIIFNKVLIVVLLAGITIFFGWFALQVKFDNNIEIYFLKGDIKAYKEFLNQFGTDEIIAVSFGNEEIFTTDNLRLIDSISRELERLPHVRRVLSITTMKSAYGEQENVFFDPLVKEIPSSQKQLLTIKRRALADPFISGILLSPDARNTAIVAEIDHIMGEFDYKIVLVNQIKELLKKMARKSGKQFYLGGAAVLDDAILRYTKRDQSRYIPIMIIVIILVVFAMFRRLDMVGIQLLVIFLSVIWTYGFLVLLGYRINIISTIIPPLLMAVSIADSMHFIADYLHEISNNKLPKTEYIWNSFDKVITPCFMTSVTTAIGLLSLLTANLIPVRQFGLVAAMGVLFAFIITMFLVTILLSLISQQKTKDRSRIQRDSFSNLLSWLGHWEKRKAITIIIVAFISSIPAALSLSKLTIGTNTLDYFRKGDTVRSQTEWIDTNISGTASLEFFIKTGEEDALKNPLLLQKMQRFQTYLKRMKGITGAYSEVDMVKSLNRAFNGGDERKFVIPSSSNEVAQLLLMVEGSDDIRELLSDDYSTGRISARVEMNESQRLAHHVPEIQRRMKDIFRDAAKVEPTGLVYLMNRMEQYLLSSQIKSFFLAFALTAVIIMILLRSVKLGILAMIPNFLPILFSLALMPRLGISLDVGTVMIAAIALGLVVDDTIHFMSRLKLEAARTNDTKIGIARAMRGTGRPIIYTSVALCLGFSVLTLSSFNPIIHFGILSVIVISLALVFDLIFLPAIMGFFKLNSEGLK